MTNQTTLACVIGRFQIDELHEGHLKMLNEANTQHPSLLILVGCTEAQPDIENSLDFETRRTMLNSYFPKAFVLPLYDHSSDMVWSQQVDVAVKTVSPRGGAVLYGSRESFIPRYHGEYSCVEIQEVPNASATKVRKDIATMKGESPEFRRGVIWARANQYPVSFQAVDAIMVRPKPYKFGEWQVALGKRSVNDTQWRFPGGIVDPKDGSLEIAVKRELREEMGAVETSNPIYIGSRRVDDYRYRSGENSLMTACFLLNFIYGKLVADDDLEVAEWHDVSGVSENIVSEHQVLADILHKHLEGKQKTKEIEHVK